MAICSECSAELPSDAPQGICPACLMRRGLNPNQSLTATVSHMESILFTDIADSTGFKARAGAAVYSRNLRRHNALFEQCIRESAGGAVIKHTGDGFFAHFAVASDAVLCALRFQRALAAEAWPGEAIRVRIGIHIGEVEPLRMANRTDLVGSAVDEAARIMSLAAGGQILLSGDAADQARPLIKDNSLRWKRHGLYRLKGVSLPIEIWQVADAASGLLLDPPGSLESAIPTEIGPYRILEQLGEGGMGTVYKAEQRKPVKRIVALKVIKLGLGSAEVIARFESERQALARMDHPSIAKVLDAGQTETGQPYFAMEYVPGVPITKFADDKKLSLQQRLELFRDVCSAIAHAHTKAIIHRDIKSSNVLAYLSDERPFVKVIDFGIAKALTGDRLTDQTFNTDRGRAIGTFDSMSPEQAEGSPDIDTRTDVYSLGVLLYELLTGAPPFDRETLAKAADLEIRRIIQEVEPPRPSARLSLLGDAGTKIAASRREKLGALEHELRAELEWIPLMAMRKDRDRRYATPLEFSADIDNYLQGRPLRAGPEKVSYRLRKFLHRNRGKVAAAAVIVLLLVGGIISTSLGMSWAMRERTIAEAARQSETTAKDRAIASAQEARDARDHAHQSALAIARGQVDLGNALLAAGRSNDAKNVYRKAYDSFVDLQASPLGPLAAVLMANDASPPVLVTLKGHAGDWRGVAFSPDSRTVLTAENDKTLKLWNLATGTLIRTFTGHSGDINTVAFSPDGKTALSSSDDHTIKLWDVATATLIRTLSGHTDEVSSVVFTPDGSQALSGSGDNTLKLWNLATGQALRTFTGHTNYVCSVAVSPDGSTAISGSKDDTIKVWNLATGKEIRTIHAGQIQVLPVAYLHDGRTAVSGGVDGNLKQWDLSTGERIIGGQAHSGWITSIAVSPDGRTIASSATDDKVNIFDWKTPKQLRSIDIPRSSLAFSPDGAFLAAGGNLFSTRDSEIKTLTELSGVECVAFSPDGRTALSGSDGKSLTLWDVATGKPLKTLTGHTDALDSVVFSSDGQTALSSADDNTLRLWNLSTGATVRIFTGHTAHVRGAVFSPDCRTALSASEDKTLKLWDVVTGKEIRTFIGHTGEVYCVAISPDGRTAISGSHDNTLKVWDLASGQEIRSINSEGSMAIMAVAFTPDGRFALSADYAQDLSLWDLATGKLVRKMTSHRGIIYTLAISPDGHTALTGNDDHTVSAWDLDTGNNICTLTGHTGRIWNVAFSPDGLSALSASEDKTLMLWDFSRPARYWDFEPKVKQAQASLQDNPDDAAALAILGNWYAFRSVNDWAVEFLEKARAGGAHISSLTLARCYWNLNQLPRAKQEFQKAIDTGEAPADYLNQCINALGNSIPATQPN